MTKTQLAMESIGDAIKRIFSAPDGNLCIDVQKASTSDLCYLVKHDSYTRNKRDGSIEWDLIMMYIRSELGRRKVFVVK